MQTRRSALAFTGATLIDGTGSDPIPDGVIIVSKGIVTAIGKRSEVKSQTVLKWWT